MPPYVYIMRYTDFFCSNVIPKIEAEYGNSENKTINKILKAHYGGSKNWYSMLIVDDMQVGHSYQKRCYRAIELILAEHYGLTHPVYRWKENKVSYDEFVKQSKYYDREARCWCKC